MTNKVISPILKPLIRRYATCHRCLIGCISATRIHYQGQVKSDILFVGDGPNDIDVALGEPFSGPPGKLLKSLIEESGLFSYRIAFTNTIICVPSETTGGRIRTIKKSEITNCSIRLAEFISIVKPKVIVSVGSIAERAIAKLKEQNAIQAKTYHIIHPSAILRQEDQGDIDMARVLIVLKSIKESFGDE